MSKKLKKHKSKKRKKKKGYRAIGERYPDSLDLINR